MAELKELVGELLLLNAENLAQRCIDNSDVEWCLSELKDMLTVDMVAVVRCKDCKFNSGSKKCLQPNSFFVVPADDDFCSYGERKI